MGNQGKIEKPKGPALTMKLLIVLGLFPLFSAQRFGFDFGGFGSGNNGYQGKQGNNGYQGKQGNNGYQGKQGNSENLPGVDRINGMLISQLKSMTNSLTGMMKEVANNPQTGPTVNTMFDSLANGCVTNMDEAIQAMQQGVGVAEAGLLGATDLLDAAIEGTSTFGEESLQAGVEAINALGGSSLGGKKKSGY